MNTSWNISCLRGRVPTVRAATGFTLVELLVSMAVTGILAATLGVLCLQRKHFFAGRDMG